ncbi:hypothetical protein BH10PSE1_BH10PSE1_27060 [soil metagenome]
MEITVQIVGGPTEGVVVTHRTTIKVPNDIQTAIDRAVAELRKDNPEAALMSGAGSYWIRVT